MKWKFFRDSVFVMFVVVSTSIVSCVSDTATYPDRAFPSSTPERSKTPTSTITTEEPTAFLGTETLPTYPSTTETVNLPAPLWETVTVPDPAINAVRSLLIDSSGNLWSGGPGGLTEWDVINKKAILYRNRDDQGSSKIVSLAESNGVLWIGTFGGGVYSKDGHQWNSYTTDEGLPGNFTSSLVVARDGKIWVDFSRYKELEGSSYFGYIDKDGWNGFRGGGFTRIVEGNDHYIYGAGGQFLPGSHFVSDVLAFDINTYSWQDLFHLEEGVTAFAKGPDGTLWLATREMVYTFDGSRWTKIIPPWANLDVATIVSSIAVTRDKTVWFGFSFNYPDYFRDKCGVRSNSTNEFGVYRYDGQNWTHLTEKDGLVDDKICDIVVAPNGDVWFGSYDQGLSRFNGKEWTTYNVQ